MTATLCADGILPPESWDEDAPDMDRLLAVCRCCICPSMAACAAAGAADPLATGVWGARFFRSAPRPIDPCGMPSRRKWLSAAHQVMPDEIAAHDGRAALWQRIRDLAGQGLAYAVIAERLGVNRRTVERIAASAA
jgi:hypothetical protein